MFTNTKREEERSPNPRLDDRLEDLANSTASLVACNKRYAESVRSFRAYVEGHRPAREAHEIPKLNFNE